MERARLLGVPKFGLVCVGDGDGGELRLGGRGMVTGALGHSASEVVSGALGESGQHWKLNVKG